jgi:predicted enzyme related to lactoylglutathione lyase
MTPRGLAGAVLYAKDLRRLVKFYCVVLGVEPQGAEDGFAVLRGEASSLVIVQIPNDIASSISIAAPPALRETVPVKLVFTVADIAAARKKAAELGGAVNPAEREWVFEGVDVCDGYDPEGNIFQLRTLREGVPAA